MSKKSVEIRCPNTHDVKGRETRCGRFLMEISDVEIRIPCPKCGQLQSIIRDKATGKLRMQHIPETAAIISQERKE